MVLCTPLLFLCLMAVPQNTFGLMSFSDEFGSQGNDNDEFDHPTDIAIGKDGDLYVVDSENNFIKIFVVTHGSQCPTGTDKIIDDEICFDEKFGGFGSNDGKFNTPISLAINPDTKDVYIVDSDNNRVQRFEADGDFDGLLFGSSDSDDDEYLGSPTAIAIHQSTDNIFVADSSTDSISVFDDNGNFMFSFGSAGSDDDEFRNPSGLIFDNDNDILYVADTGNNRIQIFEITDGSNCPSDTDEIVEDEVCYVGSFGSSGSADGKFDEPTGLAFDEDNQMLYVSDTENNRIQVFEMISSNTCPSGTSKITDGVCFVEKFGSSGTTDGKFNSPTGIAIDSLNNILYIADNDNDRIQIVSLTSASSLVPPPQNLKSVPVSSTSVLLYWDSPKINKDVPPITGYKIDYKTSSTTYTTVMADTKSSSTAFLHEGLETNKTYYYQVSSINSAGTSTPVSSSSVKPTSTTTPILIAKAISPTQVELSWLPPSNTFGQSINGYQIERVFSGGDSTPIGETNGQTRSYIVSGLSTGVSYSFEVAAKIGFGLTEPSNTVSATPKTDSVKTSSTPVSSTVPSIVVSTPPIKLTAVGVSSTQINLSWSEPASDGNSAITGYKIEVKKDSGSFTTIMDNTESTSTTYSHTNLSPNSKYTYKVSAINSVGVSDASNEASTTPKTIQLRPIGNLTIDEGKTLSFTAFLTDSAQSGVTFSLEKNPPAGAKIDTNTGLFTWTPSNTHGAKSYVFDIVAKKDTTSSRQTVTIFVNDIPSTDSTNKPEPQPEPQPKDLGIASFVDKTKDPQYYVDRYNNEPTYKEWFDTNYPEYSSIYEAVGLEAPKEIAPFVDKTKDPQYYVDRYNNEPTYKEWFDTNYPEYSSIYEAVGLDESLDTKDDVKDDVQNTNSTDSNPKEYGICGKGTKLIDGVCTVIDIPKVKPWWQFW